MESPAIWSVSEQWNLPKTPPRSFVKPERCFCDCWWHYCPWVWKYLPGSCSQSRWELEKFVRTLSAEKHHSERRQSHFKTDRTGVHGPRDIRPRRQTGSCQSWSHRKNAFTHWCFGCKTLLWNGPVFSSILAQSCCGPRTFATSDAQKCGMELDTYLWKSCTNSERQNQPPTSTYLLRWPRCCFAAEWQTIEFASCAVATW